MALSLLEVELISTLAEDLRVLLFPPRLTPAPGTIGDTLNSRRALHQEDGFREEEEERLRNARPAKERKRERGGRKRHRVFHGEGKGEIFFSVLVVGCKQWPQSVYFSSTPSLCYFPRKEKRTRQAEIISRVRSRDRPTDRPTLALIPCLSVFALGGTEKERGSERDSRFTARKHRISVSPVSLIGQHAAILLYETVEREREREPKERKKKNRKKMAATCYTPFPNRLLTIRVAAEGRTIYRWNDLYGLGPRG